MSSTPGIVNAVDANEWYLPNLELNTFTYEWNIPDTSFSVVPCGTFIESSLFPADAANGEPKWSLRVYPRGSSENTKQFLALSIVSHSESKVRATVKCSILIGKDRCNTYTFVRNDFSPQSNVISHNKFTALDTFFYLDFLVNRTLKILCEVNVVTDVCNITGLPNIVQFQVPKNNLAENFATLLKDEQFSDVKLVANGHELKAYKGILVVRSKVFAAMFRHEMEEQSLNSVSIQDVDHEVLKEMLHYIYTNTAPKLDTMAEDLFAAADKYDLQNLKLMCEKSLWNKISIETAVSTLILADLHNAEQLKSRTIGYIVSNATSVMATQDWKDMNTKHPHLIEELFCAIAKKLKIK